MTERFGPLDRGGWRYTRRPHSLPLISRTRSLVLKPDGTRADGSLPNTMLDVGGHAHYVEHYLWRDLDVSPWLHPDDVCREVLYIALAIKLILSEPTPDELAALCVKVIPPGEPAEEAPTDFQQPGAAGWVENHAQIATQGIDTPRQWQTMTVAPVCNVIRWGGCFRPAQPESQLGMAFAIFFEGYAVGGWS